MSKKKLTLYVEEEISKYAKRAAKLSGKSISTMVQEHFRQKGRTRREIELDDEVSKWIGLLGKQRSYKELREELHKERLRKYEGSD